MHLEGTVLCGPDYEPVEGRVVIEDGRIEAVEAAAVDSTDVIVPAFVNAHTHVGDSIAKEAGEGLALEALVAPPDGLKHRPLEAADRAEVVAAMRRSCRLMGATGTGAFLDFREGGPEGVEALREAAGPLDVEPVVFGRGPPAVLDVADGYGASGAADADFAEARAAARAADKPFGIHAGEADATDIDAALDLEPDFLVHMVHPEPRHLDRVEEASIPVVVCPRSNAVTGVGTPPVAAWLERTDVALGTDNVMLNGPSMFREMAFVAKVCDLPAVDVLRMATAAGAALAGRSSGVIEAGRPAKLVVLDGGGDNLAGAIDVVRAVVRRAGAADVRAVHL